MGTDKQPANKESSVQLHAALRNDYVEILVDFALRKAIENLAAKKIIEASVLPERHKEFKAVDASDVFDHYFKIKFTGATGKDVVFWGQTTCYKGNELGVPEANKTYEIRETLIETLTLRRHLLTGAAEFRILHFTFGPSAYTYGWFEGAKANTFDWSMYSSDIIKDYDIFPDLLALLYGCKSELDAYERLEKTLQSKSSALKTFIELFIEKLEDWLTNMQARNAMADKQASLLNKEYSAIESELPHILKASKGGGENIKGKVLDTIASGVSTDPNISATLQRIYDGNGFISKALEVLKDWDAWTKHVDLQINNSLPLETAIDALWNINDGDFYVTRRLLVRLFSEEGVFYPADLDIRGVTEHTLYTVTYPPEQNSEIVKYLNKKYLTAKIISTKILKGALFSARAKQMIVEALKHDTSNGTNLKPSFYYVEEVLKKEYDFASFEEAGLPLPVGYQIHFAGDATVQPYGNLKVVIGKDKKPIAIIKAKFFRKQEFPRRAKEEAYVGLTSKYDIRNSEFVTRYKLPFIMFVDMDSELLPPEFALVRLATAGWLPIFSTKDLYSYLKSIK